MIFELGCSIIYRVRLYEKYNKITVLRKEGFKNESKQKAFT